MANGSPHPRRNVAALGHVVVGTVPTQICDKNVWGRLTLHNADKSGNTEIFFGKGPNILATDDDVVGLHAHESWELEVTDASEWYAIVAAGTETLDFVFHTDV